MPNHGSKSVVQARSALLHARLRSLRQAALASRVGATVSVLVESVRNTPTDDRVAMGYSEEYPPVRILNAGGLDSGSIATVRPRSADHDALQAPLPRPALEGPACSSPAPSPA